MTWENGHHTQSTGRHTVYTDGEFKSSGQRYKPVMCGNLTDCLGPGSHHISEENGWRNQWEAQDHSVSM